LICASLVSVDGNRAYSCAARHHHAKWPGIVGQNFWRVEFGDELGELSMNIVPAAVKVARRKPLDCAVVPIAGFLS